MSLQDKVYSVRSCLILSCTVPLIIQPKPIYNSFLKILSNPCEFAMDIVFENYKQFSAVLFEDFGTSHIFTKFKRIPFPRVFSVSFVPCFMRASRRKLAKVTQNFLCFQVLLNNEKLLFFVY